MENFTGFVEVAGAIIAAMGLAMCLEWLILRGPMRLMPSRRAQKARGTEIATAAGAENNGNFKRHSRASKNFTTLHLFPHGSRGAEPALGSKEQHHAISKILAAGCGFWFAGERRRFGALRRLPRL